MVEGKRKLAAILSADVAGYSRLMGDDEAATVRTLTDYREVFRDHIARHQGRVVDMPGDNLMAEFASPVEAVEAAAEIQRDLARRNRQLAEHRRMDFRIGINLGDVLEKDGALFGDGVNIAARLESLAEAGGICISGTVFDHVKTKVQLGFDFFGEQEVKNIAEPVRAYRVALEAGEATARAAARHWKRPAIAAAAVLAVVSIALLMWQKVGPGPETPATDIAATEDPVLALPTGPSIAVLPFTNMSDDPEQEYFADGISEDLITELSRFDGLLVIARNSTFRFKGQAVDVAEVAAALGVRYVLEGSVRRFGDRVRITAQLIDAETGGHLWAERYDRELTDVFAVQDDVTRQIIAALRSELGELTPTRGNRPLTTSSEAYDLFLRARVDKERRTEHASVRAQDLFRQAIALDPAFAAGHAELSDAHFLAWYYGWDKSGTALVEALATAEKAVALDRSLPIAHAQLGRMLSWFERLDEAIASANQAIALDANYAKGYSALAWLHALNGDYALALAMADKASRLDPYAVRPTLYRGMVYFAQKDYERAIATLTEGVAINPDFGAGYVWLAGAYGQLGREAEARAAAAEVMRLSPNFASGLSRVPIKNRGVLKRLFEGLRKAGLDIPIEPAAAE